jgi:signal peptidase II
MSERMRRRPAILTSSWTILLAIAMPIAVLDQITKAIVRSTLPLHDSRTLIPGLLDLTHVRNTGAAFGLLNTLEFPYKAQFMIVVALVAMVAIAAFATRLGPHERLARVGLALILGGAIGNLIDRAVHGYVLDFVDVYHRGIHFWAFNVADAAITVGAALVLVEVLFTGHRHAPPPV